MIRAGQFLCETDKPYRRILSVTLALSVAFHVFLLLLHPVQWWRSKDKPIPGMEGPDLIAPEIAAVDPSPKDSEKQTAGRPIPQGTLIVLNIEILPERTTRHRERVEPPQPVPEPVVAPLPEKESTTQQVGLDDQPVIELGEDLAPRTTSKATMQSEDFAILKLVPPIYPEISIMQNVEGRIRVRALVDKKGEVEDIKVVESGVDLFCEEAVRTALMQWRFKPYRKFGRTVPFTVLVPFRFELED
jgi:TonB family protein